jgi:hypothetical protein
VEDEPMILEMTAIMLKNGDTQSWPQRLRVRPYFFFFGCAAEVDFGEILVSISPPMHTVYPYP